MSLPITCAAAARGEREEILAGEGQPIGGDGGGLRQKAHDGEHRHRFAGAELADDRHHLARVDVEVDAVDRLERPGAGGEGDGEVADFEEGHVNRWASDHSVRSADVG